MMIYPWHYLRTLNYGNSGLGFRVPYKDFKLWEVCYIPYYGYSELQDLYHQPCVGPWVGVWGSSNTLQMSHEHYSL